MKTFENEGISYVVKGKKLPVETVKYIEEYHENIN